MIELRCINMETGHVDIIHQWGEDEATKIAKDFCNYMWSQDKSTDHFYSVVVTEQAK